MAPVLHTKLAILLWICSQFHDKLSSFDDFNDSITVLLSKLLQDVELLISKVQVFLYFDKYFFILIILIKGCEALASSIVVVLSDNYIPLKKYEPKKLTLFFFI